MAVAALSVGPSIQVWLISTSRSNRPYSFDQDRSQLCFLEWPRLGGTSGQVGQVRLALVVRPPYLLALVHLFFGVSA
jgi:hypothetical protein